MEGVNCVVAAGEEEAGLMFRPFDLSFISFHSASTRPRGSPVDEVWDRRPFTRQHLVPMIHKMRNPSAASVPKWSGRSAEKAPHP